RPTALKVILKQSENDSTISIKRFHREMEVMGKLSHPYVIQIYTAGVFQNNPYIAMEYVEGVPILEYVQHLPENDFISIATLIQKILQAFSYIHSKQLVHRDVKSTNILVRPNGNPVVLDFGIAKAKDTKTLTATGTIMGSLNMSPEQARGMTRNVNHQSDIYSLGTILYEILTKQPVVQSNSFIELLKEIIYKDPILPSQWNPSIPPMLEYITLKSLEKKQQKRYASALLMEKDLIKFLQNTDQKKPSLYLYKKQYKKHFQKIIIFSVCLIFILIGYFYFPSFPSQQKTTKNLSMIILCENVFSQLQTQFSMHIDHIQEACNDPSVYTDLFKNITETTQYKNIKNNERYSHNLEQRLQQTPWDATLYKESAFLLTEMAKMYFENHQKEKAQEYQKKAEKKLRIYFSIRPYNRKIFTQFAEPYMYILNSNTLKEDLYVSQEFFNVSTLSLGILKFSDLFPYLEICTTYLQKEKSTWNRDKFELCKKLFQNKDHNILLQNILTPLLLAPEFCKLYQEDKEIRELFQQKREQAIQNHDIQKPIKQLLAYYYLTRDTEYLSYIFTYTNKYIPTLHYILNQDEEYFFRFLAAYVLSICKEEKARDALEETMENDENNLDSAILSYICAKKMNPQMEHPSFLNDIPTNIADTTKLIFLQYILEISDKEKKSDITDKYISPYIQDKNPNIILLAMYFMLKTLAPEYPQKLELKTPKQKQEYAEQNKEYAKNIQQIWEIIKAQEERHILLFLSLANKFFNVIEPIYAIDKNIITDIQSILEQTQNPDIQENA
ncbi:MAG TPA: serine/threonine-protein kinase, partial [Planctomycetota bacterium]|nr:serine/threonine-protein kinase [Planctomycetota bacterium]